MRRSLRSFAKRLAAPFFAPLDRRFADFTAQERKELERLDERLEIDLRIIDEHLLAMQRVSRRLGQTISAPFREVTGELEWAIATDHPSLLIVATPGTRLEVPAGFDVQAAYTFRLAPDGGWRVVESSDDGSTLRVVRLRAR